tara:strand:+ start:464 stop:709 length:246 start_codon:yes stop_codon:yes gene_type:complete
MKKINKAEAREWREQQKYIEQCGKDLERQKLLLYSAGVKRKCGYPCTDTIRRLGHTDVADKISKAYSLLEDAFEQFERETK